MGAENDKTNKMTCAPKKDYIWSVFAVRFMGS